MPKFPKDAPKRRVIQALQSLGFELVRDREHLHMRRLEPDGRITPLDHAGASIDQGVHVTDGLLSSENQPK